MCLHTFYSQSHEYVFIVNININNQIQQKFEI